MLTLPVIAVLWLCGAFVFGVFVGHIIRWGTQ